MKNYGDICLINGGEVEAVDCVIGGSPCFPGGTMIMTAGGQKPIEDVLVGDLVYTHRQRYRRVLSTGTRKASLVKLTDGVHDIICTAGHPFYSKYLDGDDTLWTPAMDMFGMRWAYVDCSHYNEFVWIEVKSVKDIHTICPVYNLEVDEDNSYVAENIVVHNCQNLSVAGNRKGLEGSESRLFLEQMRVIKEMRQATNFMKPRYMVLENVTGLLSCNKGKDFQCVLNECVETALLGKINLNKGTKDGEENSKEEDSDGRETGIPDVPMPKDGKWPKSGILYDDMGRWSIAWRIHDAQYWGVAQRRRRIALVVDFGGMSAPEVLLEPKSVQRDLNPCDAKGEGTPKASDGSTEKSDYVWDARGNGNGRCSATITGDHDRQLSDYTNVVVSSEPYTLDSNALSHGIASVNNKSTGRGVRQDGTSPTLTAGHVPGICNREPCRLESNQNHATVTTNEESFSINGDAHDSGVSVMSEVSHALKTTTKESVFVKQSSDDVTSEPSYPCICIGNGQAHVTENYTEEISQTLNCMHDPMTILEPCAYQLVGVNSNSMKSSNPNSGCYETEQAGTITTNGCVPNNQGGTAIMEPVSNSGCRVSYGETDSAVESHPVVVDRAAFNQGKNAQFDIKMEETEIVPTIVAKGPHAVAQPVQYRVRRLTPLECTRLQGYPSVRTIRISEMTTDEYIAWNLAEKNIIVDIHKGKVYGTRGPGGVKLKEPKELVGTDVNGYIIVSVRNHSVKKHCRVHRVVWIAAHGIPPKDTCIDHINNDKKDNRLENLQLLTTKENSQKAREDGLYKVHEEAGQAKLSAEEHDLIQYIYSFGNTTCKELSEFFGISKSRVHQIIHEESWVDIGDWIDSKGKKHKEADAPKYKALGNSIALPFWKWLCKNLVNQLKKDGYTTTMASLFDGIGGFPLCWTEATLSKESVAWISEIEEFPLAVTRRHFS